MARITTVRGDISPSELGFTTMHEHTLSKPDLLTAPLKKYSPPIPPEKLALKPENFAFLRNGSAIFSEECSTAEDVEYMVLELLAFKKIGGNTVVDASPIGLRGDVNLIRKASEMAEVHIVCATGLYKADSLPIEFIGKSETELITHFENEINDGIDGTGIKPGFLKCAINVLTPNNTIHESELTILKACAKVAAKNGMSLHVHSAYPLTSEHILGAVDIVLNKCGLKPDRLVMLHMDSHLRTPDANMEYISNPDAVKTVNMDLHLKLLEKGVNLSFDTWGSGVSILPDDNDRMKGLVRLLRKGYASQIVLGHDVFSKAQGVTYGGYGFTRFAEFVLPILKQLQFGDEVIRNLTIDNPARILAY